MISAILLRKVGKGLPVYTELHHRGVKFKTFVYTFLCRKDFKVFPEKKVSMSATGTAVTAVTAEPDVKFQCPALQYVG